ncbi:MAG: YraN family protein [Angustibacter sp.]
MATNATRAVGRYGEWIAVRHLESLGFQVLARNWRCELGEIDIVARDGDCLVICEVKTRRSGACGHPLDAITASKAARLRRLAGRLVEQSGLVEQVGLRPTRMRIDVVAVLRPPSGPAQVEHVRAVV